MKIWFQALSPHPSIDPKWKSYDEACARYVPSVARPDTQIHFASTDTRGPKMPLSSYVQYLHLAQVIENAVRAEREGYDAFILGGMRDLGYLELREVVDIPVIFISETSFQIACLMASKFAVINADAPSLQIAYEKIRGYGLEHRTVPGAHLNQSPTDMMTSFDREPEAMIEKIKAAAKGPINEGAELIVPGVAPINVFLAERKIREIDGVPILDCQAAVIKVAEMMVDLRKLGMPKPQKGGAFNVSRADIQSARKIYGIQ